MFWERHVDNTTSEICMQNIYDLPFPPEQIVLSQPGTWLTNPTIFNVNYYPSDFILFYQTNEAGNIDIKYIRHNPDGTFSAPIVLAAAGGDEINLRVSVSGVISWENEGKIMLSKWNYETETFSMPVQIDNGDAYSPAFSNDGYKIAWLKRNGYSSYLKFAEIIYGADTNFIDNIDSLEIR